MVMLKDKNVTDLKKCSFLNLFVFQWLVSYFVILVFCVLCIWTIWSFDLGNYWLQWTRTGPPARLGPTCPLVANTALQLSGNPPIKNTQLWSVWSRCTLVLGSLNFLCRFQNVMALSGNFWTSAICPSWRKNIKGHFRWFAQVRIGSKKSQKKYKNRVKFSGWAK